MGFCASSKGQAGLTGSSLKRLVPDQLLRLYRRVVIFLQREKNKKRSVEEVFTSTYSENRWGGSSGEYCSGSGSTEQHAITYAAIVRDLIREKGISRIVDLGCGDFTVGSRILAEGVRYTGVDVVSGLIERNLERFGSEHVEFHCLDIIADPLPDGDLCLIRQVLQHLSNLQIAAVLAKVHKYKFVVITEHYPSPSVRAVPNKDKPHGPDTRIYDDSAVYLDHPPFNMSIARLLLEVEAGHNLVNEGEVLRTFLIENVGSV